MKFKIGMLVGVKDAQTENTEYGTVSAVITTADGFTYRVGGVEYDETDIISAYREVKARAAKTTKTKTNAKKKTTTTKSSELSM